MATVTPVVTLEKKDAVVNTATSLVGTSDIQTGQTFLDVFRAQVVVDTANGKMTYPSTSGVITNITKNASNIVAEIYSDKNMSLVIPNLAFVGEKEGTYNVNVTAARGPYIQYPTDIDKTNTAAEAVYGLATIGDQLVAIGAKRLVSYNNATYDQGFTAYTQGPGALNIPTVSFQWGFNVAGNVVVGGLDTAGVGGSASVVWLYSNGSWTNANGNAPFSSGAAFVDFGAVRCTDGNSFLAKQTGLQNGPPTVFDSALSPTVVQGPWKDGTTYTYTNTFVETFFPDNSQVCRYNYEQVVGSPVGQVVTVVQTQTADPTIAAVVNVTGTATGVMVNAVCAKDITNIYFSSNNSSFSGTYKVSGTPSAPTNLNRPAINTAQLGYAFPQNSYELFVDRMYYDFASETVVCVGFINLSPGTLFNLVPAVQMYRVNTSSWEAILGSPKSFQSSGYELGRIRIATNSVVTEGELQWFGQDLKAVGLYQNFTTTSTTQQSTVVVKAAVTPTPVSKDSGPSLTPGAIVGIVLASLLIVISVIVGVVMYRKRKEREAGGVE